MAGLALLVFAALPVRLSIDTRSTLFAVGLLLLVLGGMAVARFTDPTNTGSISGLLCFGALGVGMAAFLKYGLRARWRRSRLDWERKWRYLDLPAPVRGIIKRYLDVD